MPKPVTVSSGGWKGVYTSPEPYTPMNLLTYGKNGYLADPPQETGFYGRPGFRLLLGGTPVYAPAVPFRWQTIYPHEMLDGSRINFCFIGGHVFRANAELTAFEDVTPVGVTINAAIQTRVYCCSLLDNLIVTDGVNRPWVGTNLTSTPITGTYIDYDGAAVAWTAYGNPVVYLGSVWFILNEVGGVARRADVSYSEPGFPLVGYQQAGSDNNITLSTSNSGPLFALSSTNVALNYLRQRSIGSIAGSDIGSLQSSPTEDAIAFNVGSQAGQTIGQFGDAIFFNDAIGRPYVWTPGNPPRDIWKQFRSVVDENSIANPTTTAIVATATIEPTLNKYIGAIWSPSPATQAPPTQMFIWDAPTGTYEGFWEIEQDGVPVGIECIGIFYDASGRPTLMIGAEGGTAWAFNSLSAIPEFLTTEDDDFLTTEDGSDLTTEGQPAVWADDGAIPDIYAETGKMGESDAVVFNVDRVVVTTLNPGAIRVTTLASMSPTEVEGEPVPSISQDGTYRLVVGADAFGRGPAIRVKPLFADEQFKLQRISATLIPSLAGSEDA